GLEGNTVARVGRCSRHFRQCHNHLSAFRYRRCHAFPELARVAWRFIWFLAETLPGLELPYLPHSFDRRACLSLTPGCLLVLAGMERPHRSPGIAENFGHD